MDTKKVKKTKVSLLDIQKIHPDMDYKTEFYEYILGEIEKGNIAPIKNSGLNGMKPALYNSYWKYEKVEDTSEFDEEMEYKFSNFLNMRFYKENPEKYKEDRTMLLRLNDYFVNKYNMFETPLTKNERSFDMFYKEKFISKGSAGKIFSRVKIDEKDLNYYETTEPLSYYAHSKKTPQNLLIVENKDTFYSMRRFMNAGNDVIMGLETGTLIYGAGKGIWKSFCDYEEKAEGYFSDSENKVYYFGDIDYEGIYIYEKLADSYEEEITPAVAMYERMLEKAVVIGIDNLPDTKEKQNRNIGDKFLKYFSDENRSLILEILEAGKYIPQEILNCTDF